MFRAGQAALARSRRRWRTATVTTALVAASLAGMVLTGRFGEPVERIVYVRMEPPPATNSATARASAIAQEPVAHVSLGGTTELPPWNNRELEQLAVRFGVEALPTSAAGDALESGVRTHAFRPSDLYSKEPFSLLVP
jgi:hypothetical protein